MGEAVPAFGLHDVSRRGIVRLTNPLTKKPDQSSGFFVVRKTHTILGDRTVTGNAYERRGDFSTGGRSPAKASSARWHSIASRTRRVANSTEPP